MNMNSAMSQRQFKERVLLNRDNGQLVVLTNRDRAEHAFIVEGGLFDEEEVECTVARYFSPQQLKEAFVDLGEL